MTQTLTDRARRQHEEGQIVQDNGGFFTRKILFSCTFSCIVYLVISCYPSPLLYGPHNFILRLICSLKNNPTIWG